MGKTSDLTDVKKAIIDTLKQEGKTQKEISQQIGCSQSAVSRHLNGKSVGRKQCGRKRCTTRRGDRTLRKIVEKDRFQTLGNLRKQWTESGVETSRATVHRRVQEMGYRCRIPQVKPLLNHKQRQRHLTWATEKQHWTVAKWSQVLFSDESKFCIRKSFGNQGARVWRKTGLSGDFGEGNAKMPEVQCQVPNWPANSVMIASMPRAALKQSFYLSRTWFPSQRPYVGFASLREKHAVRMPYGLHTEDAIRKKTLKHPAYGGATDHYFGVFSAYYGRNIRTVLSYAECDSSLRPAALQPLIGSLSTVPKNVLSVGPAMMSLIARDDFATMSEEYLDILNGCGIINSETQNEAALLALMEKTGYHIVQENGQRKFGGPPPGWEGPPPPRGCEVFVGKIPRDMYEDELVPVFERAGKIYEFRLMMEFSGENRGYAFVMYTNKDEALLAIRMLNNYEIRPGKFIGVCVSLDNCRLFIGAIPKEKKKEEILEEMKKVTEGVVDVIVYPSATDKTKNRGFAFVEFESHRAAAMARRKLIPGNYFLL
ncbi:unnamed protein product [Ranitomeya imitator]|uniref:RRM domain-containing protein n=1 Tax=Ranitomeya imitator TaxID=111125 RepID=A0ABN9L2H7_9NEOB|nr:unnamed protein product [Ranitomeya imitator]